MERMVDLLFVDEVSKMFRISKTTLRRRKWREHNGIPIRKVGKKLCASRDEIERWFKGLNG